MKKIGKKILLIPAALLLVLALAAGIVIVSSSSSNKGGMVKAIRERGVLRAAVSAGTTPYLTVEDGSFSGVEADLAGRTAEMLGVQLEWVPVPLSELETAVLEGQADLAFGCGVQDNREDLVQSLHYGTSEVYLAVPGDQYANTIRELSETGLGLTREAGAGAESELKHVGDGLVQVFSNLNGALQGLNEGTVGAVACSREEAETALRNGYRVITVPELSKVHTAAVMKPGDAAFLNGVNVIIREYLEEESPDREEPDREPR